MSNRFWSFANQTEESVDLFINGDIMDDETKSFLTSLFGDDINGIAPNEFRQSLQEKKGKTINLYIDSYGGDVFAASAIYSFLKEHDADIIVKITGIAASAASVIAMAGTKVLMSETAVMMIHNPSTTASGDHNDMQKAIDVLDTIKDSIINAYKSKTGLSKNQISELMENETWMDYKEAKRLGFCDGKIGGETEKQIPMDIIENCLKRNMLVYNALYKQKVEDDVKPKEEPKQEEPEQVDTTDIDSQLFDYLKLKTKVIPTGETI